MLMLVSLTLMAMPAKASDASAVTASDTLLPFVPRGSPIAGSLAGKVMHFRLDSPVQQFADVRECDSDSPAPAIGGKVCHYTFIDAHLQSGAVWADNLVTQLDPGFDYMRQSAFAAEFDVNNLAGDHGDFAAANSVGLLINGLGKMNTAAISIQTGKPTKPTPIWYNGVYIGPGSVDRYGFRDQSDASTSIEIEGSHSESGIDLGHAAIAKMGIILGYGGNQGLGVNASGQIFELIYGDKSGAVHLGAPDTPTIDIGADLVPDRKGGADLGRPEAKWRSVYAAEIEAHNIRLVGHIAVKAPASPHLASCGSTAMLSRTASDVHGTITEGLNSVGCALFFAVPYATAPDCVVSSPSGSGSPSYEVTTVSLTLHHPASSSPRYTYQCLQ